MSEKRKATVLAGLAIFVLLGGCLLALFVPRLQVALVGAAFIGYVGFTRRAMALCRADDLVFASDSRGARERETREAVRAGLAAGTIGAAVLGRAMASGGSRTGLHALRTPAAFPRALESAALTKTR